MGDITSIKFDPRCNWERKRKFVVLEKRTQAIGIDKLRAELETELVAFIPAKYRKYVRRYIHLHEPPKESVVGWVYAPAITVRTGKVDS
jgi:hypothetical protein